MKPGSLVTPTIDYIGVDYKSITFTPFAPTRDMICTVLELEDNDTLFLEEIRVSFKSIPIPFDARFWREIAPPLSKEDRVFIQELTEITELQPA